MQSKRQAFILFCILTYMLPLVSCTKIKPGENGVLIDEEKILLGETLVSDILKKFGTSDSKDYYQIGGEDFHWNDFYVYKYKENALTFHANNNNEIIRITVDLEKVQNVKTALDLTYEDTITTVIKKIYKYGITDAHIEEKFITLSKVENKTKYIYSIWFTDDNKIKWFDIYYENVEE